MAMKRYGKAEIKNVIEDNHADAVKHCPLCNYKYDAEYFGICPACQGKAENARRLCSR